MEWNLLLIWLSGFSAIVTLFRMVKDRNRQNGWGIVCIVILVALSVMLMTKPESAGYVGGGIWLAFVLTPSLLYRQVLKKITAQRYGSAAAMMSGLRFLHPFDGWWHMPSIYRALAQESAGQTERAVAMMQPLTGLRGMAGLSANLQLGRLKRDWPGVIGVAAQAAESKNRMLRNLALPTHLQALGELGQIDAMIRLYEQSRRTFEAPAFVVLRANARWMVLAYGGRPAAVRELLDHQYTGMAEDRKRFWVARALWAAGAIDRAREEMTALAGSADTGIATAARRVLDHSPAAAWVSSAGEAATTTSSPAVSPSGEAESAPLQTLDYAPAGAAVNLAGHAALDRIEQEAHHDRQYAVMPLGYRSWAVVTWTLVAMNVAMFIAEIAMGGSQSDDALNKLGAAYADGGAWRWVAANFLHFGLAHISMNMLALIALGPYVERFVGRFKFTIIYALSGVGAVGGVVMAQRLGWMRPESLVGASGAIMGLIGATTAILLRGWLTHGAAVAKRRFRTLLVIVGMQVVFDNVIPQVSGTAHLIGLGIGFGVTLLLMIGRDDRAAQPAIQYRR